MKKTLLFSAFLLGFFCGCNLNKSGKNSKANEYEVAKETLEENEKKHPVSFLAITSKEKKNIIGQRVVKGTINSSAKICTYKDIELELSFYSKTEVLLEKAHETVFEVIKPGQTIDFKTKYFVPKGTDHVKLKITKVEVE